MLEEADALQFRMDWNVALACFSLHPLEIGFVSDVLISRALSNDDDRYAAFVPNVSDQKLTAFIEPHARPQRKKRNPEATAADDVRSNLGIAVAIVVATSVKRRTKDRVELFNAEGL